MFLPNILEHNDKSSQLANRIRKNYRHLKKWALRVGCDAFRIYDRDIKELPLAIDIYAGKFCVHYYFSRNEPAEKAERLEKEVADALSQLFGTVEIFSRNRMKREKMEQYEKGHKGSDFFTVREHGTLFEVNLGSYLDTGLFLDHRSTRQYVAGLSRGKRMLNLFAYTCAFSVQAAIQGAAYTVSVDMSNTYTAWGRRNFDLNKLDEKRHHIVRADCLRFLEEERGKYDIIVMDPPTISRSKKMEEMFDIQKDHPHLIDKALKLLTPEGKLIFSTNARRFVLEPGNFHTKEITLIPDDFRDQRIHQCWVIQKS